MKQDWKYIAAFLACLGIIVAARMMGPREFNWTITYHPNDKNPFGGYVMHEMIKEMFTEDRVNHSNLTLYELFDSLKTPTNFFSLSTRFSAGEEDARALLENVSKGGQAFIAAQHFDNHLADTLSLSTSDYFIGNTYKEMFNRNDTSKVFFRNVAFAGNEPFLYPRKNIHNYFDDFDSTRTTIIAVNDLDLPVLVRVSWGKGNLFLSSTPLAFTNIYLLQDNNHEFAEKALSYIPDTKLEWTSFYQLGRLEAETPLRFILTTEALAWAYFITAGSILLFMIFEAKRRQRIIPIVKPLQNTTLEFVGTIGNLYYQNGDHKNIADKKINFLLERIRTKYFVQTKQLDENFIQTLARKSGQDEGDLRKLVELIERLRSRSGVSAAELIELNLKIEKLTF